MIVDKPSHTAAQKHLRGSSILLLGRIIALGINFGVQVLTVRYLSKGDYGAFAYALNLVSIGSSLALFSVDKAVNRFLPIYDEQEEYPSLFGTIGLTILSIFGIGSALIFFVFALQGFILAHLIDDRLAVSLLLILIALSPVQALDSWFHSMFAVFASARAIFFRRYLLGPGLKLAAVLVVVTVQADVTSLAWGYLIGGLLGVTTYAAMLISLMRKKEFIRTFSLSTIRFPVRDIYGFSAPLFYSNVVFILRNNLTVMLLGTFRAITEVADYRSVVPVARLNQVVSESFLFLYTPLAARLYAKDDETGINDLYWQTAVWISTISLPMFLVTFSLARPVTILLFGERYADSSNLLALLSLGYYFNAALGFNAHTIQVFGKIKAILAIDITAMITAIALNLILIPPYGALGAALSTTGTLLIHNLLNHVGLYFVTPIDLFDRKYLRSYLVIILGTALVMIVQVTLTPPIYAGIPLAAVVALAVLLTNRSTLAIAETFPELLRLPLMKKLLGA